MEVEFKGESGKRGHCVICGEGCNELQIIHQSCLDKCAGKVVITLQGGLVHSVFGLPECVEIEVRDYDVEGCDDDEIEKDSKGREYRTSFENPEQGNPDEVEI